jgi:hypothetical protein
MKLITDKQKVTLYRLMKATKTNVEKVEEMSCYEASKIIEGLLKKWGEIREKKTSATPKRDYSSDVLAGLAVKIVAQKTGVDEIVGQEEIFRKKVVDIYRVFSSARQECLA